MTRLTWKEVGIEFMVKVLDDFPGHCIIHSVMFLKYFWQLKIFSPGNDIPVGSVKTTLQQTILAYLLLFKKKSGLSFRIKDIFDSLLNH